MLSVDDDEIEAPGVDGTGRDSRILLAEDLQKSYGATQALRGLSFSLSAGRILGFLGPNGAGKTTAIRILTTILEPSSGQFFVDGISSDHPDKIRRKVGVLPESLGFPKRITALEYLTFFGQLYGYTTVEAKAISKTLLKEVGLDERARSQIGTFSRGMRQRLGIARALVNNPAVVFLDEPTLGLDPRGQKELLIMIRRIARERNAGVILCSHLLSEVESVCDDVIILRKGQVVATGPVGEVIERARRNSVRIRVPLDTIAKAQELLFALPTVEAVAQSGDAAGWLDVKLAESSDDTSSDQRQSKNEILDALMRAKIPVLNFEAEGGRLQDVFFQLTEEATE